MRALTVLALSLALAAPFAAGHASPDPLEVEVHVLADDTSDTYDQYDGFDIQDMYVRETHFRNAEPAVVARVYLYGGFGPAPVATSMSLEVDITTAAGTFTQSASTSDGLDWDGASVVEYQFEPTDSGTGTQGYVQLRFTLQELGVDVGESIGPFAVRTFAGGDLRDVAPGGVPVPGSGGAVVVPVEGGFVADGLTLQGPGGYTRSTLSTEQTRVSVNVQNLIAVTGQHMLLAPQATNGWEFDFEDEPSAIAEPGDHPRLAFNVTKVGTAPAELILTTDLGGRETLLLEPASVVIPGSPEPQTPGETPPDSKPTPAPLALPLLAAAGAALVLRRRE